MSYFPPSGNEVDFVGSGGTYVPPIGNNVNFASALGDPKFALISKSTVLFNSISRFSLSSGSSAAFENPSRIISINSGSTADFSTWLRNYSIDTSSNFLFKAGSQSKIYSDSSVSIFAFSRIKSEFSSPGSSFLDQKSAWAHAVDANIKSFSSTKIKGGWISPFRMIISSISKIQTKIVQEHRSDYVIQSISTCAFVYTRIMAAELSAQSGSVCNFSGGIVFPALAQIVAGTSIYLNGMMSIIARAEIHNESNLLAVGAYSSLSLPDNHSDVDCIFVYNKQKTIIVTTA